MLPADIDHILVLICGVCLSLLFAMLPWTAALRRVMQHGAARRVPNGVKNWHRAAVVIALLVCVPLTGGSAYWFFSSFYGATFETVINGTIVVLILNGAVASFIALAEPSSFDRSKR